MARAHALGWILGASLVAGGCGNDASTDLSVGTGGRGGAASSSGGKGASGSPGGGAATGTGGVATATGGATSTGGTGGGSATGGSTGKVFSQCRFHLGTTDRNARDISGLAAQLDFFTPGWMGQRDTFDMQYVCDEANPGKQLQNLFPVISQIRSQLGTPRYCP